jgi:hypothetical protein
VSWNLLKNIFSLLLKLNYCMLIIVLVLLMLMRRKKLMKAAMLFKKMMIIILLFDRHSITDKWWFIINSRCKWWISSISSTFSNNLINKIIITISRTTNGHLFKTNNKLKVHFSNNSKRNKNYHQVRITMNKLDLVLEQIHFNKCKFQSMHHLKI